MARVSFDNGVHFMDADELTPKIALDWGNIMNAMDADLLDSLHIRLAPCRPYDILYAYLAETEADLIIGDCYADKV